MTDRDAMIDAHARDQFGVITRSQALGCGLRPADLTRLARTRWVRLFPGVYSTGKEGGFESLLKAACLWTGGVVSHGAAGRLHGLEGMDRAVPEVTVPRALNPRSGRVRVHRAALTSGDRADVRGFAVTSIGRTLIDLASSTSLVTLAIAFESAWRTGQIDPSTLGDQLDQVGSRGRDGSGGLRRLILDAVERRRPLRSALEVRFWWALREKELELPLPRHELRDPFGTRLEADFAYPRARLVVETNGRWFHGPKQFEQDCARLSRLAAMGWRVLHVTRYQLDKRPDAVWSLLDAALKIRP